MAASVYKGLTIQIGADTTKLTSALRQAQKSAEGTTKQLRQINSALKLDPHNTELLAQKQELLTKQIAASNEKLGILKETMKQVSKEDVTSEQWTQLVTDISRTESQLEKLKGELEETARQERLASSGAADYAEKLGKIGDKAQEVGGKIESVGDKIQSLGGGISNIGGALTAGVTAPIVAAAGASVKAAIDIDSGLTSVKKTVDGTEEQYQQLKDAAIEFSQTNAVGADQMLEIDALGAQLGFAIEELELFGQVASGLDIATDMDAETASTEMAQFANITKMAHDDIERYASSIVNVGNNMATTESKVSAMSQRIAAAGTQVKMSQADILGWSGAMSSLGIEAEAGGSAFSTIISKIDAVVAKSGNLDKLTESQKTYTKAIEDAQARLNELNKIKLDVGKKGMSTDEWISLNNEIAKTKETISSSKKALGETDKDMGEILGKLESFAGLAGMSGDEFRKAWGENATDTLQKVLKGLDGVDNKTVALEELEITELRQVDAMKRLAGNTDLVSEALKTANEGWNENTALQNEVDNRNESLASKFEILKNKVVAVADQVGKPLADALLDAVDAAEPLIEMVEKGAQAFADMSKEEQQNMLKNVALVASLGPLLSIAGKTVSVFGGMVKGVGAATKAFGSFSSGLSGKIAKMSQMSGVAGKLGGALSGVSGGLIGIGAAAGIAVAAFAISKWQEYQHNIETTEKATKSLSDMQKDAAESAEEFTSKTESLSDKQKELQENLDKTSDKLSSVKENAAKSADEFEKSWADAEISGKTVDDLKAKIEGLRDRVLTGPEQETLVWAVQRWNEETGGNLEVLDQVNGKLSLTREEIEKTGEAAKNARKKAALEEQSNASYDAIIQSQDSLPDAYKNLQAARKQFEDAQRNFSKNGSVENFFNFENAKDNLTQAENQVNGFVDLIDSSRQKLTDIAIQSSEIDGFYKELGDEDLAKAMVEINKIAPKASEKMRSFGVTTDDLQEAVRKSGVSAETFAKITGTELSRAIQNSDGDVDSLAQQFKQLDIQFGGVDTRTGRVISAFDNMGAGTKEAAEAMGVNMDEVIGKFLAMGGDAEWLSSFTQDEFLEMVASSDKTSDSIVNNLHAMHAGIYGMQTPIQEMRGVLDEYHGDSKVALEDMGYDWNELSRKLVDAGINTDTLKDISKEDFEEMASSCGGNVDDLTGRIKNLDNQQIEEKTLKIDASPLDSLLGTLDRILGMLGEIFNNPWKFASDTWNWITRTINGATGNAAGGFVIAQNAAGGIKIPKHADGGILSKPTLTSVGWVGEAGAEAIIPLDNPNYSRKFARAIAQQMTSNQTNSKTVQIILNGAVLNDDAAMQEAALDLLEQIQRRAGMNRG